MTFENTQVAHKTTRGFIHDPLRLIVQHEKTYTSSECIADPTLAEHVV